MTKDQLIKGGIRDVRVFERGVDSVLFHPGKRSEAVRVSLGVAPDAALVLYAGRLSKEKSLDVLLGAFMRLADEASRSSVGGGWRGAEPARFGKDVPEAPA